MAIGERIRFLRNLHGATQKWLGIKLGFSEKTAETRVGQYEIGVRTPKDDMIKDIAKIFGVSPQAIKLPDIDNYDALLHTLFAIEDIETGAVIFHTEPQVAVHHRQFIQVGHHGQVTHLINLAF